MIIFLYGEDNFRSQQKFKQIIGQYQKIHQTGINLKHFDFTKQNFQEFRDQFQTKSMFKEKKLFVLKNVSANKEFQKKFQQEKEIFIKSENIILFYEKKDVSQKNSFFIFLKENSQAQEFSPLKNKQLENWIKKELKIQKMAIESPALNLLINYVGNNLWQFSNEIEKLVHYKQAIKEKKITEKDVEKLVVPKIDINIFKTIDAIAEKNKRMALCLVHQHLKKDDSPLYLLSMIAFQFRNLLMIKTRGEHFSARELGMHPFVARKSFGLCQHFTLKQLKKIYQMIFKIDLDIKSGKIEPDLALDLFITQI